jgi:hypothetical protein
MFGILGLIRDISLLAVLTAVILGTTYALSGTVVVAPERPVVATATTTEPGTGPENPATALETTTSTTPLSPRVEDAPRRPVATTTPPTPKPPTPEPPKPKPAPPPAPLPKPETPKVEDLNITLQEAIQSISSLAAGQSTSSPVNDRVRGALVNIICTTQASGPFNSISGSGIIIDPRGVILTNAHVAQFFLLKDFPTPNFMSCIIRTGSPAYPRYTAELMFLPPTWIRDNAQKIDDESPTGTGERDYALLRITGGVSASVALPSQFPFLLVGTQPPDIGSDVLQAGYAAGFLGGITIQNELYASSAWTKVRDVYTFNANTVDLFSLGGSIVAQSGSSGGPVVNTDGVVQGVIVTSTQAADTASRDLRAITTSYIIRDFTEERGKSLKAVLSTERLSDEVEIYNKVYFPTAKAALVAELVQ